jgi:hypothetical protein
MQTSNRRTARRSHVVAQKSAPCFGKCLLLQVRLLNLPFRSRLMPALLAASANDDFATSSGNGRYLRTPVLPLLRL